MAVSDRLAIGKADGKVVLCGFSHRKKVWRCPRRLISLLPSLAAIAEVVRMWEALFAFHICIACFRSESARIPGFPQRIPDRRKLLTPHGRFQVSASIPSTTLGGMECHHSSGAQHRACCGTNDCVVGIDGSDQMESRQYNPTMPRARSKNLHIGLGFL